MLINNVTIENFRCYYGENNISFNKNGKITLIYGDSGRGKSSFLQFFRWMFYSEYDFGKTDDKAIFNEVAYKEKKPGDKLRVSGRIDFEHLGVQYSLVKTFFVVVSFLHSKTFSFSLGYVHGSKSALATAKAPHSGKSL